MNPIVCVSGLPRGDVWANIERLKKVFPYPFHFATWESQREALLDIYRDESFSFSILKEPEMHYHPGFEFIGDCPKNYQRWINSSQAKSERWKHRTKQILGHAMQLEKIDPKYDMIIRARYDTEMLSNYTFMERDMGFYARESFLENKAIGFFTPKGQNNRMHLVERLPKDHQRRFEHLPDHLIMHPRSLFNTSYAWELHESKRLIVAEIGWYQVLSEPYGSNHESIYGFFGVDLSGQP